MKSNTEKEIKVVIFEDYERWQELSREILESLGVVVVAIVDNMITATDDIIPQLETLGVQYVLLDANLKDAKRSNGADGKKLAKQIRQQAPLVKIIGFSSESQDYVDIKMGKAKLSKVTIRAAMNLE